MSQKEHEEIEMKENKQISRRRALLAITAVSGTTAVVPAKWITPVVNSVTMPAHAFLTDPEPTPTPTPPPPVCDDVDGAVSNYFHTGALQQFQVPALITSLNVTLVAAGGGGGGGGRGEFEDAGGNGGRGASGETIITSVSVTPGEIVSVYVGGAGAGGSGGSMGGPTAGGDGGVGGFQFQAGKAQNGFNGEVGSGAAGAFSVGGGGGGGGGGNTTIVGTFGTVNARGGNGGGGGSGMTEANAVASGNDGTNAVDTMVGNPPGGPEPNVNSGAGGAGGAGGHALSGDANGGLSGAGGNNQTDGIGGGSGIHGSVSITTACLIA